MKHPDAGFQYEDEILRSARDPNLNREKGKTSQLLLLIQSFPLTERTISRLCQLSLSILQTLEKIELSLRNWAFMSLDMNSPQHFNTSNPHEIKTFNNNVSVKVINSCQDFTVKLNKISADMDFITKALRNLTPVEYLIDSGTLLMSLSLRNIKLKDELREKVTIAYLKAKLITIGTNLETMLRGGTPDQKSIVQSYKQFVVNLLAQLNSAIESQNSEEKNECLAVISDMEQMFEVFKLECAQNLGGEHGFAMSPIGETLDARSDTMDNCRRDAFSEEPDDDLGESSSLSTAPTYLQPMVHSITKPVHCPSSETDSILEHLHLRRGLLSSLASTRALQKLTLSEELPYLMSAFNLAKTLEEDVCHFKDEEEREEENETDSVDNQKLAESEPHPPTTTQPKRFLAPACNHLPQSSLYTNSQILSAPPSVNASSYLYSNNSLLSKLGIKPQVVSAALPRQLNDSVAFNKQFSLPAQKPLPPVGAPTDPTADTEAYENKENKRGLVVPLTRANLDSHNLAALPAVDIHMDPSYDYVE